METPAHGNIVHLLTKHYFGEHVASVIKILFNYDQASLRFIRTVAPELRQEDLKKSLLILVKYQLVDYVKTVKNLGQNYEYSVAPERIFYFYRIPQFIRKTSARDGSLTADVLTLLAERGMMSKSRLTERLIKYTQTRGSKSTFQELESAIASLVHRKYLVETSDNVCINIERFNRDYRDDIIIETLSDFYNKDSKIKSICKTMIDLSYENTSDEALISAPVPLANMRNILCPGQFADEAALEKCMSKLVTEVNFRFFISSGTHPQKGPMYAINIGAVIDHLAKEHLCSMITSKFGPKCCRVFRVLLQRGPLLLKQIEEFIMLPTKDVREYSYILIKEGLVRNRQVPKTLDNAPGKSVFIMSVEVDQVIFKIADLCCRTMSNLLTRYEFEVRRNQSLLAKANAVRELVSKEDSKMNVDDGLVTEEWNDYFNTHELLQLSCTNKNLSRLLSARIQVDETLFLTHIWLKLRPSGPQGP